MSFSLSSRQVPRNGVWAIAVLFAILCVLPPSAQGANIAGMLSMSGNNSSDLMTRYFEPKTPIGDINIPEIADKCNATYKVSDEYLQELNDTGSYPDETDQNSMCYLKCYLEKVGIFNEENQIFKQRAIEMLWPEAGEAIDECLNEMTGNPCEQAYFLARCLLTRGLVDGRSRDT